MNITRFLLSRNCLESNGGDRYIKIDIHMESAKTKGAQRRSAQQFVMLNSVVEVGLIENVVLSKD